MFRNNMLKIMSVVIAIMLWLAVASESIMILDETVAIRFKGLESGLAAVADVAYVDVKAKVPRDEGEMSFSQRVALTIDTTELPVGESSYKLEASMFDTPNDFEIIEITPKNIVITIDHIVAKQIKIEPIFINEVTNGFVVDRHVIDPASVVVEGVSSAINTITSVKTLPINLARISENTTFSIGLVKEDGVEELQPSSVGVRVIVKPNIIEQSFNNIYVSCMGLSDNLTITALPLIDNVTLTGRSDLVESFLNEASFFVNCNNITEPGKYTKAINYRVKSKDVKVTNLHPSEIQVEIDNK